ncbi:MAG: lipopolysaccharide biosynthesis protein [Spirosomataceae bacterium]
MRTALSKLSYVNLIKKVGITGLAQVTIQFIGFVSGILIIRNLSIQEYALYTLSNTLLGTMTILADGGISMGVMSEGGKVWKSRQLLGEVLATGVAMRRKFAIYSLVVMVPSSVYLLMNNGASWMMSILISISIIPAFYMSLTGSIYEIAPKLHQDIIRLQKIQIWLNIGRLGLLSLSIFIFPWAFLALFSAGLPQIWSNAKLKKLGNKYANLSQNVSKEIEGRIYNVVKRILPGSIYYSVSGQLVVWILSLLGSNLIIAQVGALGRLSILINLVNIVFMIIIVPRFSRSSEDRMVLLKKSIVIILLFLVVLMILNSSIYILKDHILGLLGEEYSELSNELVLSFIAGSVATTAGLIYSLYTSRGWMISPIIYIPINLLSFLFFALSLDLSNAENAIKINIYTAGVQCIMNFVFLYHKINECKNV